MHRDVILFNSRPGQHVSTGFWKKLKGAVFLSSCVFRVYCRPQLPGDGLRRISWQLAPSMPQSPRRRFCILIESQCKQESTCEQESKCKQERSQCKSRAAGSPMDPQAEPRPCAMAMAEALRPKGQGPARQALPALKRGLYHEASARGWSGFRVCLGPEWCLTLGDLRGSELSLFFSFSCPELQSYKYECKRDALAGLASCQRWWHGISRPYGWC